MMKKKGSILLLVLVLMLVFLIIVAAGSRLIAREFRATVDTSEHTQAFHVAESGVTYTLWLLNVAGIDPGSLQPVNKEVKTTPDGELVGYFATTYETSQADGNDVVEVTSVGTDASREDITETVQATLTAPAVPGEIFTVQFWDHEL